MRCRSSNRPGSSTSNGKSLVNSLASPPQDLSFADRDYFYAHVDQNIGTFIGAALTPRPPYQGATLLRHEPAPRNRRWQLHRRHPGLRPAGIFRELLCQDRLRSRQLLRHGTHRRRGAHPFSPARTATSGSIRRAGRPADRRSTPSTASSPSPGPRTNRAARRLQTRRRISDLCQRRARDLGDPRALARHHGPASGVRHSRHGAAVSAACARVPAHPASPRRGRQARRRPRRRSSTASGWKRSASSPAVSRTISTISSP